MPKEADVSDPSPPVPEKTDSTSPVVAKTQLLNLDANVGGLLCYVPLFGINVVFSLIWFLTEPKTNQFLRFHALQSLIASAAVFCLFIAVSITTVVLGIVPLIGPVLATLQGLFLSLVGIAYIFGSLWCVLQSMTWDAAGSPRKSCAHVLRAPWQS